MKTKVRMFTSFIIIITAAFLSAQNQPVDFEAGGYGADWTWTVFENDTNPPLEIVTNPDMSEPNPSTTTRWRCFW